MKRLETWRESSRRPTVFSVQQDTGGTPSLQVGFGTMRRRSKSGGAPPHCTTQAKTVRGNVGHVMECGGAPPLFRDDDNEQVEQVRRAFGLIATTLISHQRAAAAR